MRASSRKFSSALNAAARRAAPAGEAVIKRTFPGGAAAGDPEENVPDWLRNEFEDAGGDDGGRVLASARSQQHHAGRGVGHRFVAYFDNTSYRMEKKFLPSLGKEVHG